MITKERQGRQRATAVAPRKRVRPGGNLGKARPNWIFVGVGLLLFVFALRGVLLIFAGMETSATVTGVFGSAVTTDYRQPGAVISYAYSAPNGRVYTGTFSQPTLLQRDELEIGDSVEVRYLPAWPSLQSSSGISGLAGVSVLSALGGGLFIALGFSRPFRD